MNRSLPLLCLLSILLPVQAGCREPMAETPVPPREMTASARAETSVELQDRLQLPTDRPLRAAFLIVNGVFGTELTAPYDILQHTAYHVSPGIEVYTVSPDGKSVRTAEGLEIAPQFSFETAPQPDFLIIPSAEHSRDSDLEREEWIDWVARTGEQSRFVVSLCWGAFVLAESGLLDGRDVTTFPSDYDRMAQMFPALDIRVNVSFVHDGPFLTSQGGVRSFDVAMYLVSLLYGDEIARRVGDGLLITWPPRDEAGLKFVSDPAYLRATQEP